MATVLVLVPKGEVKIEDDIAGSGVTVLTDILDCSRTGGLLVSESHTERHHEVPTRELIFHNRLNKLVVSIRQSRNVAKHSLPPFTQRIEPVVFHDRYSSVSNIQRHVPSCLFLLVSWWYKPISFSHSHLSTACCFSSSK